MIGLVLIILGIISLGTGVYLVYKIPSPQPGVVEQTQANTIVASAEVVELSPEEKSVADLHKFRKAGLDFENYVVLKFDRKQYAIKNWAGDKFVEGRYAETTLQPDLTLELKYKGSLFPFAVECKWRSKPKSDYIQFAKEAQLKRYQQFAVQKDIPTFIVLGVGGIPSAPDDVYVIPVDRFTSPVQKLERLEYFKRKTDEDFYFNFKHKFLK